MLATLQCLFDSDEAVVRNLMVAAVDIVLSLTIAAGCAPAAIVWFVLASVGGWTPKSEPVRLSG